MASYLRPRRGKRSTANSTLTGSAALKNGEVFFEYQNGNSAGGGVGGIKMGNGSTTYSSLPYFVNDMNNDNATLGFTNSSASSSAADSTLLGAIIPSNNLKTVLTNIKQLLWNHSAMIAKLNSDMIGFKYMDTSDGRYYTATVKRYNTSFGPIRFPIQIWTLNQSSGYLATIGGLFSRNNNTITILFNNTIATYNANTKTITVDQGGSAWSSPLIVYPLPGIIFD